MDQKETLERLHGLTEDNGGVAIIDDPEWLTQGQQPWQKRCTTLPRSSSTTSPTAPILRRSNTKPPGTN
ncbi:hypothetical protein [Halapricum salinum]|uniref:hypothetical protein n=1 Tax=Halapricum salinum TaxID=1457250 RepID=UPI0006790B69|nr:hypothetical protein [Halapricum salinum]